MANRAQRRANNKAQRRAGQGPDGAPEATRSATDQAMFNQQADRVADGRQGEWKPGRVDPSEGFVATPFDDDPVVSNPDLARRRTGRDWLKLGSWVLIVLAAIAFLIIMWINTLPDWTIITVSAVFAVGVLSLFVTRSDSTKNPYLDENGTAV